MSTILTKQQFTIFINIFFYTFFISAVTLQCMASINVCQLMIILTHTQIYIMGTLGTSCTFLIRLHTSVYAEAKLFFWTCSKKFSICKRIDYTLLKRSSYAGYSRHTLNTLEVNPCHTRVASLQRSHSVLKNCRTPRGTLCKRCGNTVQSPIVRFT